jgi:nucleoside permease NupC
LVKKRSKVPEYLIGKVNLTYKDCINDVTTKFAEAGWSKTSDAVSKESVLSQSHIMLSQMQSPIKVEDRMRDLTRKQYFHMTC